MIASPAPFFLPHGNHPYAMPLVTPRNENRCGADKTRRTEEQQEGRQGPFLIYLFPFYRHLQHHHRPLILHAFQADTSAESLHHHLAVVEAETASCRVDFMNICRAEELLEKMLLLALRNTDAGIGDDNLRGRTGFLQSDCYTCATARILHGVAQD